LDPMTDPVNLEQEWATLFVSRAELETKKAKNIDFKVIFMINQRYLCFIFYLDFDVKVVFIRA
jgi:hypothetical protein